MVKAQLSLYHFALQTYTWDAEVILIADVHILDGHLDIV
jgi:hypothetical protein